MAGENAQLGVAWRKSSFSGDGGTGGGNCVEVAALTDGRFAIRDSKSPSTDVISVPRAELAAWLGSIKAGNFG
ncbi:DUF397 domain-containing protein [Solihabitans fulvus]|uniref:DUF397 domain-containing protein n=2 Tax=Solihabitans fulvus TaxID=1892852 RepID=A0A5B2WP63_9PSEU|nr:DUF397 domain-containing protein [Solihabitans fulvus]